MSPDTSAQHRVLIAGGGVAGLEALLALRDLAGDRVALTLLAPEREFTYRPMAVGVPFARGHMQRHDLADVARASRRRVRPRRARGGGRPGRAAVLTDGRRLGYDSLLVAVGAGAEPAFSRVRTWTPELDQEVFGGLLADLEEGYAKRVAFVVPQDVAWPLPAYELALMTAWDARDMGQDDVEVTVYTPEESPLAIFGSEASAGLRADLEEAGVSVQTGVVVQEDPDAPARLLAGAGGPPLGTQRVIALPRAVARGVGGLATDERGFIRTDGTAAWSRRPGSGRPATRSRSRSSRAASPPSRPTPPPRRSPRRPGPTSRPSRSIPSCAACC